MAPPGVLNSHELCGVAAGSMSPSERKLQAALREHRASLCRAARALCGNQADADDLVHDVYERALRSAVRSAAHQNLRAYLHSILRNLFIDRCRRARTRPRPMSLDDAEFTAPVAEEPGAAWQDLTAQQVSEALAELPLEFRIVFELHVFEHLRYGEIARRLDLAPATVGTRLLRARLRLRAILLRKLSAEGARAD